MEMLKKPLCYLEKLLISRHFNAIDQKKRDTHTYVLLPVIMLEQIIYSTLTCLR